MFVAIDKSRCQIRPDAIENDIGYIVAIVIVIEMKTLCRVQTASWLWANIFMYALFVYCDMK